MVILMAAGFAPTSSKNRTFGAVSNEIGHLEEPGVLGAIGAPLQPGEALEVIGEFGFADLNSSSGDADSADDQTHPLLLTHGHVSDR